MVPAGARGASTGRPAGDPGGTTPSASSRRLPEQLHQQLAHPLERLVRHVQKELRQGKRLDAGAL